MMYPRLSALTMRTPVSDIQTAAAKNQELTRYAIIMKPNVASVQSTGLNHSRSKPEIAFIDARLSDRIKTVPQTRAISPASGVDRAQPRPAIAASTASTVATSAIQRVG